ncbi:MAG: hypothetical protein WBC21_00370 [Minisyncoccales bacterium]
MKEKLKPKEFFTKDRDNLEMLRQSLESKEIDEDIIPTLEKFFSLPITPRESCYGHVEKLKEPYFSYIEDDAQSEQDENFQKLFKEKIAELTTRINQKIGSEAVNIVLEEIDRGGGPKDYTLRFKIIDKKNFQKFGKNFFDIIWEEFSRYLDEIR